MKGSRENTAKTIVKNLISLMAEFHIDKPELSKKSGVSPRMVSYILSGDRKPSIDVLDKLAEVLGISAWQLMIPNLHADLVKRGRLDKLIKSYASTTEDGREHIDLVAAREAQYRHAS